MKNKRMAVIGTAAIMLAVLAASSCSCARTNPDEQFGSSSSSSVTSSNSYSVDIREDSEPTESSSAPASSSEPVAPQSSSKSEESTIPEKENSSSSKPEQKPQSSPAPSSSSKPASSSKPQSSSKPASSSSIAPGQPGSTIIDDAGYEHTIPTAWGDPTTNTFHDTPTDTTGWELDANGFPADRVKWAREKGGRFFDKNGIGWATAGGRWYRCDQYGTPDRSVYYE